MNEEKGLDYKQAGVDIDAANQSVDRIKKWVEKNPTSRSLGWNWFLWRDVCFKYIEIS